MKVNIADRFTSLEDVLDNDVVSVDDDGVIFVCLPRSETWLVISLTAVRSKSAPRKQEVIMRICHSAQHA